MTPLDPGVKGRAASWTMMSPGYAFINSPITNSDVSAVLGVRSHWVFAPMEPTAPTAPPEQADACARIPRQWTDGLTLTTTLDAELLSN